MSDYFCNIYNFRNLALSRQKQAPVQTLSAFNDFGSGNIVCGQSDGSFYGRNFAHKPFITFSSDNSWNSRCNPFVRSYSFFLSLLGRGGHIDSPLIVCMKFYTMP